MDEKRRRKHYLFKNKGRKINVWGGINYYGKLSLHLFYENLNSDNYINILEDALLEMNEINREKKSIYKWIMQKIIGL